MVDERRSAVDENADQVERGLRVAFLTIRGVHVAQGAICVASGWSSYRRPRLAALALAACTAESGWLVLQSRARGTVGPAEARVDTGMGIGGLLLIAVATHPADRTTSMNWMLPYSVGGAAALPLSFGPSVQGIAAIIALAGTYLATCSAAPGQSAQRTTAIANAASYVGFFAVAETVVRATRRAGRALDAARREAAERSEQLVAERQRFAVERERNRQHRLIHDSALQTLEVVAHDLHRDPAAVRTQARIEAGRLRRALAGTDSGEGLGRGMQDLVEELGQLGLRCAYTSSARNEPSIEAVEALVEATREALRNVLKHAGVGSAVIRVVDHGNGVEVTVRDQGVGFDTDQPQSGFGLRQSVNGRLAEVDGAATIWSQPGRGTRVTLSVPG